MGASNSRSSFSKYSGYFSAYSSLSCSNVFPMKFPSLSACSFSSVRHVLKLIVKKNKYRGVIQVIAFTDCELVYSLFKIARSHIYIFNCYDYMLAVEDDQCVSDGGASQTYIFRHNHMIRTYINRLG